jgi:hypothetical protein
VNAVVIKNRRPLSSRERAYCAQSQIWVNPDAQEKRAGGGLKCTCQTRLSGGRLTLVSRPPISFGTMIVRSRKESHLWRMNNVFSRFPPLVKEGQGGFKGVGKVRRCKSPSAPNGATLRETTLCMHFD